jgi:RimJ/RimL family protein N-acetyltransferase
VLRPDLPRELSDGVVRLREITPGDAGLLYRLRMDPLSRPLFRNPEPVSYDAHLAFLERYFSGATADCWFAIEAAGSAIGAVALHSFSEDGARCESGRLAVAPEARGRGYARRATGLLVAYARLLGVREVDAFVAEQNAPSLAVFESLGFRRRGAEKESDGRVFLALRLSLGGAGA